MAEGIGVHRFWGASPALDLASVAHDVQEGAAAHDLPELRVLVVDSGDIRHALRTLASARRLGRRVRVFLLDGCIETLARHLLLLRIAADWERPLRWRANTLLEVLGNAMVQERTSQYVAELGKDLVRLVCDGQGPLRRLVDLSQLRFKEADGLEKVLLSWGEEVPFAMPELRDSRLRALHGARYDSRAGQVDWDYQTGIKPQHPIVHFKQYKHWRETGVAFEFGDQTYTEPNRSLSSYAQGRERGQTRLRRGFWGDIALGPYHSFGVLCDTPDQNARDLFKVLNKGMATEQHRHTAVHVSVYSVLGMLYEIETGKRYRMTKPHDVYSGIDQETKAAAVPAPPNRDGVPEPSPQEDQDQDRDREPERGEPQAQERPRDQARREAAKEVAMSKAKCIMDWKDRATVTLLVGSDAKTAVLDKAKYAGQFDVVWLSNHSAHLLRDPALAKVLRHAPGGRAPTVAVETARNMVVLQKDKKTEFLDKVRGLAAEAKMQERACVPADCKDDPDVLVFTLAGQASS